MTVQKAPPTVGATEGRSFVSVRTLLILLVGGGVAAGMLLNPIVTGAVLAGLAVVVALDRLVER